MSSGGGRTRTTVTTGELARLLAEAARSVIAENAIAIEGLRAELRDEVELRVKLKEKEGRRKFKIEIVWPVAGEGVLGAEGNRAGEGGLKAIKKEMDAIIGKMRADLAGGKLPDPAAAGRLDALVRAFAGRARAEWRQGLDELGAAVARLTEAISAHDIGGAGSAVRELYVIKGTCHRRFK